MLKIDKLFRSETGQSIAVTVRPRDGTYLLECLEASAFLRHITAGRLDPVLPPDAYVRGYVSPEREAFFQIFDDLGSLSPEIQLSESETLALVRWLC